MLVYQIVILVLLLLFLALVLRNLRDYAPLTETLPPRPDEQCFVLIPARNEKDNIADCLERLLAQNWRDFTLLVLDDNSDDGTAEIIAEIAARDSRLQLLHGKPIPPGWAGKVWACSQLGDAALERGADWLLFLDADTRTEPDFLGTTLAHAQTTGAGMVSTFPYQITGSFWERVVLPNLHFLILTFLPVRMVWEAPFPQLVAACGQVELFSAEAYRAVGGHGSIPKSFHDGLQLARRVKAAGKTVRLYDGSALISCRMYAGGQAVWNGFTRNAYEGLGGPVALLAMTFLQIGLFLLPFVFLLFALISPLLGQSIPAWGRVCAVQAGVIVAIRALQAQRFGHTDSLWLHPLSMLAMTAIQWASFWKALRKTEVVWKGRAYGQEQSIEETTKSESE